MPQEQGDPWFPRHRPDDLHGALQMWLGAVGPVGDGQFHARVGPGQGEVGDAVERQRGHGLGHHSDTEAACHEGDQRRCLADLVADVWFDASVAQQAEDDVVHHRPAVGGVHDQVGAGEVRDAQPLAAGEGMLDRNGDDEPVPARGVHGEGEADCRRPEQCDVDRADAKGLEAYTPGRAYS